MVWSVARMHERYPLAATTSMQLDDHRLTSERTSYPPLKRSAQVPFKKTGIDPRTWDTTAANRSSWRQSFSTGCHVWSGMEAQSWKETWKTTGFPSSKFDSGHVVYWTAWGYTAVSTKVVPSVKAYATLPIGIIGSNSLAILNGGLMRHCCCTV